MSTRALLVLLAVLTLPASAPAQIRPATSMPSFASYSALRTYLRRIIASREGRATSRSGALGLALAAPSAAADASGAGAPSITNTQHAGVDEGDIVKLHGNHLVILRRGRLFTVAVGGGTLRSVDASNAFGPDINPDGTWYDEMLIAGDKVVVIGYSYERGGTEVGIFRIDGRGELHYLSTYQLRSDDYYSARNYSARLVGTRLVFYAPLYLPWSAEELETALPAVRRWRNQDGARGFVPVARAHRVYRPAGWRPTDDVALHTVTSCELAAPSVSCEATVVVGPPGNVFYVSAGAVYVWMSGWDRAAAGRSASLLARIPLDGSAPSAMAVAGSPVDQFSFLESGDGWLNVLTRADGSGDAMWSSQGVEGPAALLRLPLDSLGDGSRSARRRWYRRLETPAGYDFQNRFVGDFLLYGVGNGWDAPTETDTTLFAVPWRGGEVTRIALAHGIDRIEVMGGSAVVVGVRGANLEFTGISLRGTPAVRQRFTLPGASQGELRSHGFFYRGDGATTGVLGLPVVAANRPGWRHIVEGSASVLFLRNTGRRFASLGVLEAGEPRTADDGCHASCVDWYGNARPLFLRGRVFALLGYELVEGQIANGAMHEVRRVSFAPGELVAANPEQ